jgi:N-acetyl-anhydromuramyl-L-alanine amidase AmpD
MEYKIKWVGNEYTNRSSRKGHIPLIIVDHISEGREASVLNWGRSSGNNVSSWHFFVTRKGEIYQFVKIEDMAWVNGLKSDAISKAKADIIQE